MFTEFEEFKEYAYRRGFNPIAKYGKGKVSTRNFKMSKEMVERYKRLVTKFDSAWANFCAYVKREHPNYTEICAELEELYEYWYYTDTPLRFGDGSDILTDWERAKEYHKAYVNNIKKIYESGNGEYIEENGTKYYVVDGQKFIAVEYRKLDEYEGNGQFSSRMVFPINVLAREFNNYWLPLLTEQGGHIHHVLGDGAEPILADGFIGSVANAIMEAYEDMELMIQENTPSFRKVTSK